ncbi:MAG: Lar family restriction alleviation protein [Synergistaceae bacterium]|nr:Lar family restriction alleviation protein [Synergistaceae bacterium]
MSNKFKPCPFCGCDDIGIWYDDEDFNGYQVYCESCGYMSIHYDTPEEAREAWNRRANDGI